MDRYVGSAAGETEQEGQDHAEIDSDCQGIRERGRELREESE